MNISISDNSYIIIDIFSLTRLTGNTNGLMVNEYAYDRDKISIDNNKLYKI